MTLSEMVQAKTQASGCIGAEFYINQKLDKTHYGAVYHIGLQYYEQAIIESKVLPLREGTIRVPAQKIGFEEVQMNNGFTKKAQRWKICDWLISTPTQR